MATYIPGITDYIPQIQPFQPDLNFYANVLQTRQGRYDNAKTQLNSIYSSVFNAALSKEENIQRRDAFMKAINEDLKKISGLDLSLQQNADAAMGIFKGFYEDKYIADDIVKTKKYRSDMSRAEALRNCNDSTKCPGYWDEGVEAMQYRMEEYKKLSLDESLNYDIGGYDAYVPWKKEAIEKLEKMNYTVERDRLSGDYIVHDKNGVLVKEGLEGIIQQMYGDDPRIRSNYETLTYVNRKRATKNGAAIYGSEEEAEKNYILKNLNEGLNLSKKNYGKYKGAYDEVNSAILKFEDKQKKGTVTQDELDAYEIALAARDNLGNLTKQYENDIAQMEGDIKTNNIDFLRRKSDAAEAYKYRQGDITNMATLLSKKGEQHLIKPNEFKVISARGAEDRKTAAYRSGLDEKLERVKSGLRMDEMDRNWKFKYTFEELKHSYDLENLNLSSELKKNKTKSSAADKSGSAAQTGSEGSDNLNNPKLPTLSDPGSDVQIDLTEDENLNYIYQQDFDQLDKLYRTAEQNNTHGLYMFFQSAKAELAKNNNDPLRSVNSTNFLSQFGDNWNNIRTYEDFKKAVENRNISASKTFDQILKASDIKKNPAGDMDWARSFIQNNPDYVEKVKISQDAYESVWATKNNVSKAAAQKIKDAYNPADDDDYSFLISKYVSNNGTITTKDNFVKEVSKLGLDPDDAEDIYTDLSEKFLKEYNKLGGTKTTAGAGLSQETEDKYMIKSFGYEFPSMDPANRNKDFNNVMTTLMNVKASPDTKIVFGDPTQENLANIDEDAQEAFKPFLDQLYIQAVNTTKENQDRPTFKGGISSIAGGNKDLSALKIKSLSPEYLKPWIGTSENPGPLYDYKDQLSNISLVYNNKTVETPFKSYTEQSDFQTLLRTKKNYSVNSFGDFKLDYSYINDDNVQIDGEYYEYNLNTGERERKPIKATIPLNAVDNSLELLLASYKEQLDANKTVEIAKYLAAKAKANK